MSEPRHMKTLFVLHRPHLGEIDRLQEVLGPDFVVVQIGHGLGGRRDLKAAIIAAPTHEYLHSARYRDMVEQYVSIDVTLRLDGGPLIRL